MFCTGLDPRWAPKCVGPALHLISAAWGLDDLSVDDLSVYYLSVDDISVDDISADDLYV